MMEKKTFTRSELIFKFLIFASMLLIFTSVVFGQNIDRFKKAPISDQITSDKPYLKLSDAQKNWQPIPVPIFHRSGTPDASENPLFIVVYDVATKTVTRSVPSRPDEKRIAPEPAENAFDSEPGSQQVETIFPPDDRIKISPTNEYPWRTICKLYITFPDGNNFVASGVIVGRSDGIGFHCLTAGHCVYRKEYGGWADKIDVIPALDNDYTPFYIARATLIKANDGWINNSMPEYDWACITLDRQVGNFTGWMGRYTNDDLNWYKGTFHCAGYPIDRDFGLCLYYDSDSGRDADQFFHWYYMDTFSGQSGMPIWTRDGNTRKIVALHIADADSTGSNVGIRLNREKLTQLDQWLMEDPPPPNFPDLVDDGPKWSSFDPDTVVRGFNPLKIKHIIRNIGTAKSNPVTVAYYASSDEKIESGKDVLLGTIQIPSLSPFYTADVEWSGVFPKNSVSGDYYIGWLIDPNNNLLEFNENNNNGFIPSKQLHVIDPYITVKRPNGGEPFAIGEENLVQWFTAGGSGLITIDISYDNGESWQNLVTNFSDSGKYMWSIPRSQQPVFTCLIRITDTFENLTDESNSAFILETRPTVPGIPQDEGIYTSKTATLFSWTTADDPETGISGYQIQVGTSPNGNDLADTLIYNQLKFAAATQHNKMIYARVRAINGVGLHGPWSISSDGIFADLTPPILQGAPFDEGKFSGTESVRFKWNAAIEEETGVIMNYKLQVGTAIGLSDIFDKWINRRLEYTVVGKHGQTLFARIKAHNAAIGVSDWSDWSDGITIDATPPSSPGKPYAEDFVLNFFDIAFYWDAATEDISHIIDYQLIIVDITDSSQVVFDRWVGNVGKFLARLKTEHSFIARVRAKNGAGLVGAWSQPSEPTKQLEVIDPYINLLCPVRGESFVIGEQNFVQWFTAGGSGLITIDISYNNGESWQNLVTNIADSGKYIWTIPSAQQPVFTCLIRITDTSKNIKDLSTSTFTLETPPTVPGIPQDEGLYTSKLKTNFSWTSADDPETGISGYQIQIGTTPGSHDLADTLIGNQLEFTARTKHNKTIYARIRAINGVGLYGPWSGSSDGIFADLTPPILHGGPFDEGEFSGTERVLFRWNAAIDEETGFIINYNLQVGTAIGLNDVFDKWINRRLEYAVIGKHGQTLYARIRAHNAAFGVSDLSDWSDGITIDLTQPSAPEIAASEDHNEQRNIMELPKFFSIEQNYPNPFNPETKIRYQLPVDSRVRLTIHNLMGQEIVSLVKGNQPAGFHSVTWNGRDAHGRKVPSGVYFYNLHAGNFRVTKKMILIE